MIAAPFFPVCLSAKLECNLLCYIKTIPIIGMNQWISHEYIQNGYDYGNWAIAIRTYVL